MKLFLFSDIHIDKKAVNSQSTKDGLTTYLHRVLDSFKWISTLVKKYEPTYLCFLGDLFETKGYVDDICMSIAVQGFRHLVDACGTKTVIKCLVGNHDWFSEANNIHSLEFLKDFRKNGRHVIDVIDKPKFDTHIAFLPYSSIPVNYSTELKDTTSVVLTHTDVIGGLYRHDYKCDSGIEPDTYSIPVFNGHLHCPNQPTKNWYNIGALLSRNYKDANSEPRGLTVVDFDPGYSSNRCDVTFLLNYHDIPILDIKLRTEEDVVDICEKDDLEFCFGRVSYTEEVEDYVDTVKEMFRGSVTKLLGKERGIDKSDRKSLFSEEFSPLQNFNTYIGKLEIDEEIKKECLKLGKLYIGEAEESNVITIIEPITILDVIIENFMSFGKCTVVFENGLVFLEGYNHDRDDSNGSGKTSLVESVYWCLTGKTFRGYTGDDVIRYDQDNCTVVVNMYVGNTKYTVKRFRVRSKSKQTGVKLYCNDIDISADGSRLTDIKLQQLLGRSDSVLKHSVFLIAGLANKFTSLNNRQRLELIEEITDTGVYSIVFDRIKQDKVNYESKLNEVIQTLHTYQTTYDNGVKRLKELEQELGEASEDKKPIIDSYEESILVDQQVIDGSEKELVGVQEKIDILQEELSSLDYKKQLTNEHIVVHEKDIARCDTRIRSNETQLRKLVGLINSDKCPTCKQDIDSETTVLNTDRGLLEKDIAQDIEHKRRLEEKCRVLDTKINKINERFVVPKQKEQKDLKKQRSVLESIIRTKTKDIIDVKFLIQNELSDIEGIKNKIEEVQRNKKDATNKVTKLKVKKEVYTLKNETYQLLLDIFHVTGIRTYILNALTIPYLNNRLADYGGRFGWDIQLDTEKEQKSGNVVSGIDLRTTHQGGYTGCSSGERRGIDLSIQLAFNDLSIATGGGDINLLVCDEVLDTLDQTAIESFLEIVRDKSKQQCVMVCTHRPFIDVECNRKVRVEKKEGESSLV